jgi:CAAX protease family protein
MGDNGGYRMLRMTKKPLAPFIGYLIFFYFAWTFIWVYTVYPWANKAIGNATLTYALINIAFRFLIWVLPVFWYLRYVDKVDVFEYLPLKEHWKRGIVIGLILSVVNFFGTAARLGFPNWNAAYVTWNSVLGTSLLVGVFEEVPFRGFILRKLQERFDFWTSTVISSILFVGAHVPGWIMLGLLTANNVIFIFVFGAVMVIILKYSKSLWAPIITHSLNDCISGVIFHI